jgi:hypothetical protein
MRAVGGVRTTACRQRCDAGAGLATALIAAALAAGGVALLEADGDKDAHGFVSTDSHEFRSSRAAIVSDNLDVDLDGGDWLVDGGVIGDVRLQLDPEGDEPVFVGIARTDDAQRYLRDVGHTVVEDIDYDPFDAAYREIPGDRRATPQTNADMWSASTTGRGDQSLEWELSDGDWSVVVMNADGSNGVKADIEAGAKLPWLDEAGWGALGGGALLGAAAIARFVTPSRASRSIPSRAARRARRAAPTSRGNA